jgi:transcriptional accessory protein Tex/SPT6
MRPCATFTRDILAERISDHAQARAKLRELFWSKAVVKSKVAFEKEEAAAKFKDYFNWSEPVAKIPSHRMLAIRRGESEGLLIGVHQDGLVHVSQLSDRFVKDPVEVVKVQQKVMVTVTEVDLPRKRIALSMKAAPTLGPSAAGKTSPGPSRPQARVQPVKPPTTDWFTEALNRSKKG